MYVQILTLEGFFPHIHLLRVEISSPFSKNLILRYGLMSMNCEKANPGPIINIDNCDVETQSLQCTNTESGLHSEIGAILSPAVKHFQSLLSCYI